VKALKVFNGQVVALLSSSQSSVDIKVVINGADEHVVPATLFQNVTNLIAATNFGSDDFSVSKVAGVDSKVDPGVTDMICVDDDLAKVVVPYLLNAKQYLTVGKEYLGDKDNKHGFAIIMNIKKSGGSVVLETPTALDCQAKDASFMTAAFLDENVIAVVHNLGSVTYEGCSKQSTSLATFYLENSTLKQVKCLEAYMKDPSLFTLLGRLNDESFILASSFYYQFIMDNIVAWRTTGDSTKYSYDTPYVALLNKDLAVVDAFSLFRDAEPQGSYQPVGFVNDNGSAGVMLFGQSSYRFSSVVTKSCVNGVFAKNGSCVCYAGGFGEGAGIYKCAREDSSSSESSSSVPPGSGSSSSAIRSSSSPLPLPSSSSSLCPPYSPSTSSSSGRLTPTSGSTSGEESVAPEDETFLESQLSVIVFACTAAAFLVVTIVFVALFSNKRCGKSSGKSTEMDSF